MEILHALSDSEKQDPFSHAYPGSKPRASLLMEPCSAWEAPIEPSVVQSCIAPSDSVIPGLHWAGFSFSHDLGKSLFPKQMHTIPSTSH